MSRGDQEVSKVSQVFGIHAKKISEGGEVLFNVFLLFSRTSNRDARRGFKRLSYQVGGADILGAP
jgi:hypothetical protein